MPRRLHVKRPPRVSRLQRVLRVDFRAMRRGRASSPAIRVTPSGPASVRGMRRARTPARAMPLAPTVPPATWRARATPFRRAMAANRRAVAES